MPSSRKVCFEGTFSGISGQNKLLKFVLHQYGWIHVSFLKHHDLHICGTTNLPREHVSMNDAEHHQTLPAPSHHASVDHVNNEDFPCNNFSSLGALGGAWILIWEFVHSVTGGAGAGSVWESGPFFCYGNLKNGTCKYLWFQNARIEKVWPIS